MQRLRKLVTFLFSLSALAGAGFGVYRAMHSPLFLVRVVEIADQAENSPVDAQALSELAAVPLGKVNLFDLDLSLVERRLLTNPWIREARLLKRFPETLAISVVFREPRAILQGANGKLSYIDTDGKGFGELDLAYRPDLPIFSGFGRESSERVKQGLELIEAWENSAVGRVSQIASLQWDMARGFRALVTRTLVEKPIVQKMAAPTRKPATEIQRKSPANSRLIVEFGTDLPQPLAPHLARLARVFEYLTINDIGVREIWVDSGKKIVVKTAHGS